MHVLGRKRAVGGEVYPVTSHPLTHLLRDLGEAGIQFKDLKTDQSSLEDIFVTLVKEPA